MISKLLILVVTIFCLTACAAIEAEKLESMSEENRLQLLAVKPDQKLCNAYLNDLTLTSTKKQIGEILVRRGVKKCRSVSTALGNRYGREAFLHPNFGTSGTSVHQTTSSSSPNAKFTRGKSDTTASIESKSAREPKKKIPPVPILGSGFYVNEQGYIATNAHIVRQCASVLVSDEKGNQLKAELLMRDIKNDLALLKSRPPMSKKNIETNLGINVVEKHISLNLRSVNVKLGESILVAGFPFGKSVSSSVKISTGIASALVGIGNNYTRFQIDAAVHPGSSGGPVLDGAGNIVGVVVSRLNQQAATKVFGEPTENTNFVIKVSALRTFLEANGVNFKSSQTVVSRNTIEIAELAQKQTVMVECVRG